MSGTVPVRLAWVVAIAGCWRGDPGAARPAAAEPEIRFAVATGTEIEIVSYAGGHTHAVTHYPTGEPADAVYWIGDAAHDVIAIARANQDHPGTDVFLLVHGRFVEQRITWPELGAPPNAVGDERGQIVEVQRDQRDLHISKCAYNELGAFEEGPRCAVESVASVWPVLRLLDNIDLPFHEPGETPFALPRLGRRPAHVIFETTDRGVACSDGISDPREIVTSSDDTPYVETIVVDPPIVRVTAKWAGYNTEGIAYQYLEGCARSQRFESAAVSPDGTVILYGKDLAIVRDGKIRTIMPGIDARSVAFPPPQ